MSDTQITTYPLSKYQNEMAAFYDARQQAATAEVDRLKEKLQHAMEK